MGHVRLRHSSHEIATQLSPVILWIEVGGKPKWPIFNIYTVTKCAIARNAMTRAQRLLVTFYFFSVDRFV